MQQLSTNRNFLSIGLFPAATARDLNTIINGADGQTTLKKDADSYFRLYKTNRRINWELNRRGIDYRVSSCFCSNGSFFVFILIIPSFVCMSQMATAMNLLSADYNQRG